MIKLINTKNLNQFSNIDLTKLNNNEFYVLYTEDGLNSIAYIKAKKINNNEIEINFFEIDPEFKSESIEKIILSHLIYFAKKNKYKKIYTTIEKLKDELITLKFNKNNTVYEKNLNTDIKEDKFVKEILIFSTFIEISSIITKFTIGILFNSFTLFSDAFHILTDFILLIAAYITLELAKKPKTIYFPHGYKKIQNIAALIIGVMILIGGFILFLNTTNINKFINLKEFEIHFHINNIETNNLHNQSHNYSDSENKKNILKTLSNESFKKSIWVPLISFIFLLAKIIEFLIKNHTGKKYNNSLLLALASVDKNCMLSHGAITLSLFFSTYLWSGFDKITSILIIFIIIKEGFHIIVKNTNDLLSKQNIHKKRKIKKTLINIGISNFKELEFSYQGNNNILLYIKLDLKYENDLKNLEEKIKKIKNTIKNKYKEINEIHILI